MIIGHQHILQFFEGAKKNDRLAHAYCFVGANQVGKRTVARQIAADLLDVPLAQLETHPDFYAVERLEDEKTGKLKKELAVSQAREIRSRLQRTSWSGGYQVTIINEAELLNDESANALLKILEEPGSKSILFLLTEDEGKLLSTIRSRSQLFYFSLVPEASLAKGLEEQGVAPEKARELATLAWGRPGRALSMVQNPERTLWQLGEISRFHKLIDQPFYLKLKIIDELFGSKDSEDRDSQRQRDHLQQILDIWIGLWREVLRVRAGMEATSHVAVSFPERKVAGILDQLFEAKILLRQNIHPRLLVEQIILQF